MAWKRPTATWDEVPLILDIPYVAGLLGLSEERIRQLCVSGYIPAFKIGGLWRIAKPELMQICQSKEAKI